jgi:putative ABC transport system permease protein
MLLGTMGAGVGLGVAYWLLHALISLLPAGTPRVAEIGIDARVLGFTVMVSLIAGLASGLLPALRASRGNVHVALKSGSARTGTARRRLSETLVVAQLALAVVLVAGAGLLIKSLWLLRQVDPGFRAEQVVAVEIPLPSFPRDTATRARAFYDDVLTRVRALPRMRMAAVTSTLPFGTTHGGAAIDIEAHPTPPGGEVPFPELTTVSPDYLRVLGIPLLSGRAFETSDREGAPLVAVVDASAARTLWPNESPLGQRIKFVWSKEWITVVGVVGDVRRDSLSAGVQPSFYLPYHQAPGAGAMHLVLRLDGDDLDETMSGAIRSAIASVDRTVPPGTFRTLRGLVDASAARPRFATVLLAAFAAVALLLGAVGIYGVISYAVTRRTREIGVRMALGARRFDVLMMVAREGGWLTAIGVGAGLLIALGAGRLLGGLLYGVRPADPLVFVSVPAVLALVAFVASVIPARRASRVDPVIAMRE